MEKNKKIRKQVQLNKETVDFIKEEAKKYGLSESSFINICIKDYKDKKIMIEQAEKQTIHAENQKVLADKMNEIINQIEEIKRCK